MTGTRHRIPPSGTDVPGARRASGDGARLTHTHLHELRSRENGGTVKTLTQKALIRAMAAAGTITTLVAIGGAGRKW